MTAFDLNKPITVENSLDYQRSQFAKATYETCLRIFEGGQQPGDGNHLLALTRESDAVIRRQSWKIVK